MHKPRSYPVVGQVRQLEEFKEYDSRGKGMHSAAINSYRRFLADLTQVDVKTDVQQISEDQRLTETEKSIMVNTRMGQGRSATNLSVCGKAVQ